MRLNIFSKLSLSVFMLCSAMPCLARSGRKVNFKPSWYTQSPADLDPNVSFLNQRRSRIESSFVSDLLRIDPNDKSEMWLEYLNIDRNYEWREKANIADNFTKLNHVNQMHDLSKKLRNSVRRYNVKKSGKEVKIHARKYENLKPIAIAVAVATLGTGAPIETELDGDVRLHAFANVPYQVSYMRIESPYGTGSLSLSGNKDPGTTLFRAPPDWIPRDEVYRVSLSKGLSFWDLGTGMAYGGSSHMLSTSLSKHLTENLSAELATARSVGPNASSRATEETFKLSYKLLF